MSREILVGGAGLTGCAAARRLAEAGRRVVVLEQRGHIGGNCHDAPDEHGLLVHIYGPHIFHTRRPAVAAFLGRFTAWRPYEHRVAALLDGRLLPLPFNLTSLRLCRPGAEGFGAERHAPGNPGAGAAERDAEALEALLVHSYGYGAHVPVLTLRGHPDPRLRQLGAFLLDRLFDGYTRKQWGLSPAELPPSVTARVPLRVSHDDRYFTDAFQAMPAQGYAALFAALLDHPCIRVETGIPLTAEDAQGRVCLHTGAVDAFFNYALGALPYRSVEVRFEHLRQARHLPVAVVNEPSPRIPHTRVTEYRLLTGQPPSPDGGTTVGVEYPRAHEPGRTVPGYPVRTVPALDLYRRYREQAGALFPQLFFAGRLGSFRYYNMDDAVLAGFGAAAVLARRA